MTVGKLFHQKNVSNKTYDLFHLRFLQSGMNEIED